MKNLLSNAVKFTQEGSITIAATQGEKLLLGTSAETLFADYLTTIAFQQCGGDNFGSSGSA